MASMKANPTSASMPLDLREAQLLPRVTTWEEIVYWVWLNIQELGLRVF